jgi:hypothetical protein
MRLFISTLAFILIILPEALFAQASEPVATLINLPIEVQQGGDAFTAYINILYAFSISVAALLAVIKIIIAGAKYMLTDIVTSKGEALKEIKGALLGLLLILGAVLILTIINPRLSEVTVRFDPQATLDGAKTPPPIRSSSEPGSNTPAPLASLQTECQKKVDTESATMSPSAKQRSYENCFNLGKNDLESNCTDIYGRYNENAGTCQKPTVTRKMDDFKAEFEAYKATLPATDYEGKGATSPSLAVEKILCQQWGGTFYDDTYVPLSNTENTCLKY